MPKLAQRGIAHILVLIILVVGLIAGLYLVQHPAIFKPKASISSPIVVETSLTLSPAENLSLPVGYEIPITLFARSDSDAANLFVAKIKFPQDLLEVVSITTSGSGAGLSDTPDIPIPRPDEATSTKFVKDYFIRNWVENYFNNDEGAISLVGGVPNPGIKTIVDGRPNPIMATIIFKTKKTGQGTISLEDDSAIYRNSDNVNILTIKRNTHFEIVEVGGDACQTDNDCGVGQKCQLEACPQPAIYCAPDSSCPPSPPCNKRCVPDQAKPSVSPCQPRPGCLDTEPRCLLSEPSEGWCPAPRPCRFWEHYCPLDNSCKLFWESCPEIFPNPIPSAPPSSSPHPIVRGDGNGDGKIDLVDMSVLLSNFHKPSGFPPELDLKPDGQINVFDYSFMIDLLLEKKVIRR